MNPVVSGILSNVGKIAIAVLIFGIIIAIHELGHFTAAKLCHIRVNEFAIGMGPAIWKKKKGETLYALRLFPVGGFCSMEGEDENSDDGRAFHNRPIWQQVVTLAAGAFMNIILGLILVVLLTAFSHTINSTTVYGFAKNASSQASGMMAQDEIVKVNGMRIYTDTDILYQLSSDQDGKVTMDVRRNGELVHLDEVQFSTTASENGKQTITVDFSVYALEKNPANVLSYSIKKTCSVARLIWISLTDLIQGKYGFNDLSGPVGIVGSIGTVIDSGAKFAENVQNLTNLAVFITVNVGIFNLLPIPALDGCRILLRIGEGIFRKRIKPEVEGIVHFVGLALLMVLMVAVTFNDVIKLAAK